MRHSAIPDNMSFHNRQHPGNGEAAIDALVAESAAFNAAKRYRLQSMPDVVIDFVDAPTVLPNLFAAQDRLADDIATLLPHIVQQTPVEAPPYDYGQ